jgi:Uri superfamily endonuclease
MPRYEPQTVTIFGGHPDVFLIEITGKGCEKLRQQGRLQKLLEAFWHAVTRIDIAHDLKCETRPLAFARDRGNNRFKSFSHMQSKKGETCYIGSPTSDLMVRVYRYEKPHPRSDKLRIEYVARRKQAKIVAEAVVSSGVDDVSQGLGSRLKWLHRSYPGSDVPPIKSYQNIPTKSAGTILWLSDAVRPAIARLIQTGELTRGEALALVGLD